MDLLQQIVARAKADKQRIVLPEAEEERTLKAADKVLADDLADIILIGNPANIKNLAAQWGLNNIDKATIVDPQNNPKAEEYAEKLAELRMVGAAADEDARAAGGEAAHRLALEDHCRLLIYSYLCTIILKSNKL